MFTRQLAKASDHQDLAFVSQQRFFKHRGGNEITHQATQLVRIALTVLDGIEYCSYETAFIVMNPVNVLSAIVVRPHAKSVLLHLDGMEDQRRKWGFVARRVHLVARYVAVKSRLTLVTDSRAIQSWYLSKYGRETLFIPYGGCEVAEADASHRWDPEGRGDFYMVLARAEPENQIYEICSAFLRSTNDCTLVVVGAPRQPTKYWKKVQELVGDSPRIRLAGSIYEREPRCDLYRNTRGVIHGHTVGGTNPSLVDALSHGCPVLPHDNPYNREVAGDAGVYWKTEDDLLALLNDTTRSYPRIDADEFITRYNWNDVANAYFVALGLLPEAGTAA